MTQRSNAFLEPVDKDDVSGSRVSPPPTKRRIEKESDEDSGREERINQSDTSFSLEHGVPEGATHSRFATCEGEHDERGTGCPDDAEQ